MRFPQKQRLHINLGVWLTPVIELNICRDIKLILHSHIYMESYNMEFALEGQQRNIENYICCFSWQILWYIWIHSYLIKHKKYCLRQRVKITSTYNLQHMIRIDSSVSNSSWKSAKISLVFFIVLFKYLQPFL